MNLRIFQLLLLCVFAVCISSKSIAKNTYIFIESDTLKKDTIPLFEKSEDLINAGKILFYGTWTDYFSGHLKIKKDSSFEFSWGFNGRSCWTKGRWERKADTFYFIRDPGYSEVSSEIICPLPNRLCYFKHKLFLLDSVGNPVVEKISSPYMSGYRKKFRTFYFREKAYNLDYFDSSHYERSLKRDVRIGFGAGVTVQPVPDFSNSVSVGFIMPIRYIFKRKENRYLSISLPFTMAFTGLSDTGIVDLHFGGMLDVPVIFDYNRMFGMLKQGGSKFEYYFGAGIAYHYNLYSVSESPATGHRQLSGFGAVTNVGIRSSYGKYRVKTIELRISYMRMIIHSNANVFGTAIIFNP